MAVSLLSGESTERNVVGRDGRGDRGFRESWTEVTPHTHGWGSRRKAKKE